MYKRKMFAITHIEDGRPTLTFINKAANHYFTRAEAEVALNVARWTLGDKQLKVRGINCHLDGTAIDICPERSE